MKMKGLEGLYLDICGNKITLRNGQCFNNLGIQIILGTNTAHIIFVELSFLIRTIHR